MLTEHDKNRLLTLTFRVERLLRPEISRDMQMQLAIAWIIDDWQRERRMLENEDRQ